MRTARVSIAAALVVMLAAYAAAQATDAAYKAALTKEV